MGAEWASERGGWWHAMLWMLVIYIFIYMPPATHRPPLKVLVGHSQAVTLAWLVYLTERGKQHTWNDILASLLTSLTSMSLARYSIYDDTIPLCIPPTSYYMTCMLQPANQAGSSSAVVRACWANEDISMHVCEARQPPVVSERVALLACFLTTFFSPHPPLF